MGMTSRAACSRSFSLAITVAAAATWDTSVMVSRFIGPS
jgi:hypothetical protein